MNELLRMGGVAAVLLTVTACAARSGIPADALVVTPLTLEPPPIYSLLGYRTDLNLTSEQVTRLDSIAQSVRDENRELVEELRRTSSERRSQGGVLLVSEEGRPVLAAIRENQVAAVDAVSQLLDETQREQVCSLTSREGQRGRRGESDRRAPESAERRDAGDANDERDGLQRPVGWTWCQTPAADEVT